MSQAASINLQPLDKKFRNKLERTVKEARDVAEEAARAACRQLGVGLAKPDGHLTDDEKDLRRRLRIHGRQLGDKRDPQKETQQLDRLVDEIAYEHWHRMLFARFLAENDLLMYPDPDDPVSVSIDDCNDLAADEGAKNGWELAARFAARMLPQIFRLESPVFSLTLPPENQQQLERLLAELPDEVFTASDSLGWVYQFWQAKRKDEVNTSEVKIGARELPAVTQLFTEPYMVNFLLDNSLGAWWAARRLSDEDLRNGENEQELRDKASLPGVPLEYLRFIRRGEASAESQNKRGVGGVLPFDRSAPEGTTQSADDAEPCWAPAAGAFDSWPESLAELKTLDPCCGSGHFLVASLLMLAPIRMELEGLSAREAVDRVLSDNIHGLEIDQRCVELAAFALALTAWRFPEAGGYRPLPDLNVACCGLSVSVPREEWKELAKDNQQLRIALDWMYDEFKDAPILGSLLRNTSRSLPIGMSWNDVLPALSHALSREENDVRHEASIVAHGLARAFSLLSIGYSLILTNAPFLSKRKQIGRLQEFCDDNFKDAKGDLATVMLERCLELSETTSIVLPQHWLFLGSYQKFRRTLLNDNAIKMIARLGPEAFETISGHVVNVVLSVFQKSTTAESDYYSALDVSDSENTDDKARDLFDSEILSLGHAEQLDNPDCRIVFSISENTDLIHNIAETATGVCTFDGPRFIANFWENETGCGNGWEFFQGTVTESRTFFGCEQILRWENGEGQLCNFMEQKKLLEGYSTGIWRAGSQFWGKRGILVSLMSDLPASLYLGGPYDQMVGLIRPKNDKDLSALWSYCSSADFSAAVREIDQALKVTNATLGKIGFDATHWQQVAAEKYPHGLPRPYSDDPTQWIFHGHPANSNHALQIAVARVLGYRWPTELDDEMELAEDARAWIERSGELTDLTDKDGIVCIPAVGTEPPAEDRLLNLLHKAYESGHAVEKQFQEKLDAGDTNDSLTVALLQRHWQPSLPGSFNDWLAYLLEAADHKGKTLGSWLRDKFFTQQCKQFQHRPFIWHIWDGLKDGFSVLVNYHRLDNKLLKTLIYTYLNDWINRRKQDVAAGVDGSEEKLAAAEWLKERLELILHGESPHDIFVRWKPLAEQPIGWNPDLNDGVRLNIRPWMTVGDVKKKGAGLLRDKPNIHWKKDRGKDVESAPWYHLGPEYDGKEGDRINDHHLTLDEKLEARKEKEAGS